MTATAPETIPGLDLIEHLDWQPACANEQCKRPATHVMHLACSCVLPCCLPCATKVKHETDWAMTQTLRWECNVCHRQGTTYPILRIEPLT